MARKILERRMRPNGWGYEDIWFVYPSTPEPTSASGKGEALFFERSGRELSDGAEIATEKRPVAALAIDVVGTGKHFVEPK